MKRSAPAAPRTIPRLLSVRAICDATTLPRSTVYEAIYAGELPHVRIGGRGVRVDEADVIAWIDSRRAEVAR